jgi:hypothetical protein
MRKKNFLILEQTSLLALSNQTARNNNQFTRKPELEKTSLYLTDAHRGREVYHGTFWSA